MKHIKLQYALLILSITACELIDAASAEMAAEEAAAGERVAAGATQSTRVPAALTAAEKIQLAQLDPNKIAQTYQTILKNINKGPITRAFFAEFQKNPIQFSDAEIQDRYNTFEPAFKKQVSFTQFRKFLLDETRDAALQTKASQPTRTPVDPISLDDTPTTVNKPSLSYDEILQKFKSTYFMEKVSGYDKSGKISEYFSPANAKIAREESARNIYDTETNESFRNAVPFDQFEKFLEKFYSNVDGIHDNKSKIQTSLQEKAKNDSLFQKVLNFFFTKKDANIQNMSQDELATKIESFLSPGKQLTPEGLQFVHDVLAPLNIYQIADILNQISEHLETKKAYLAIDLMKNINELINKNAPSDTSYYQTANTFMIDDGKIKINSKSEDLQNQNARDEFLKKMPCYMMQPLIFILNAIRSDNVNNQPGHSC